MVIGPDDSVGPQQLRDRLRFSAADGPNGLRFERVWIDGLANARVNKELWRYFSGRAPAEVDMKRVREILSADDGLDTGAMTDVVREYCDLLRNGRR